MAGFRAYAIAVVALLNGTPAFTCHAGDFAAGPYRELCRGMNVDFSRDEASLPRALTFRVHSTVPEVKPDEIRITLGGANDSQEIQVAADGTCILPVSKALFDADVQFVSNQPKGTLRIHGVPAVAVEDLRVSFDAHIREGRIEYRTLAQIAIKHRQEIIREILQDGNAQDASENPNDGNHAWSLVLRSPESTASAMAIVPDDSASMGVARPRRPTPPQSLIKKVAPGVFVIPYTESLAKDNHTLALSANSSWTCEIAMWGDFSK